MTLLTTSTRVLTLDLRVNDSRDPIKLVEQVAKVIDVDIGEDERREWIQIIHIRTINVNKETVDAKTS